MHFGKFKISDVGRCASVLEIITKLFGTYHSPKGTLNGESGVRRLVLYFLR